MSTQGFAFQNSKRHQDETWTAVDAYTLSRVHPATQPNHQALLDALRHSREQGLPDIGTAPAVARLYAMQCKATRARHALEIGTLGGYTSIYLASENPSLVVTTIEINAHHASVAIENVTRAGVADRVDVRLGAALDVIPQLRKEIDEGKKEKLGFVYIDADKLNNWNYVDAAIPLCEKGACIFVDNIVQDGKLVDQTNQDEMTRGARRVVEMVGKDDRLDAVVLQFVTEKGYDGLVMAVVR